MVHLAIPRAAVGLLVVLVLATCAGCGSSNSSKVSTATYVKTVCSAISPLEHDIVTRTQALSNSKQNATQAKQALQGFLAAVAQDADRAVSKISSAGTPDITGGEAVAADIVKTFTQLRDAMHAASAKAKSLPTDSPSAYRTAAQALNAGLRQSLNNIDASGLSNPDIEKAAAKEPACKSLSGG
jgi:outer membrane murein-binding lipoprotein Lpp